MDHNPGAHVPALVLPPPTERSRSLLRLVFLGTLLIGCWAAWFYHAAGLTLSHYDAKAHLAVARRVFDNLTPGWKQLGAVWLPLPHLLNLLPVQIDAFYRTGASAVVISVLAFGVAAFGVARIVGRATRSSVAASAAALVFVLNPDVLYLQSTPMTESLLMAAILIATSFTWDWVESNRYKRDTRDVSNKGHWAGWALAAACLTRYEAWPVVIALLALAVVVCKGRRVWRLALYPATAVAAFLLQSRLTVGKWFVSDGFYVADNIDTGKPLHAIASVWWGAHLITGYGVLWAATASAVAALVIASRTPQRRSLLALLALFAVGSLPAYAFFQGHPFRIRYMTSLVPALAVASGLGIGFLRTRWRNVAALAVVCVALGHRLPLDLQAPMVLEAQWDSGNSAARREVTRYLVAHWNGRPIMASMQSLAHYMQELSGASFRLRDFLHEGNGDAWQAAFRHPAQHVDWILIEEWAEGGDRLAHQATADPQFLAGFKRVAEGGGVALYRRR